ncbi:MAG TPA: adenosylcobinamide-GDP ribazoletransferase [Cyclobacteriaceae bacterium]
MKKELQLFFTALMFYTRIPCPQWVDHASNKLNDATKYFCIIGIIVGSLAALVFIISDSIFPKSVAILFSMVSSLLITGAFHEDGLADSFDGFGGGWTRDQILSIMKDSRVGTFGAIGLIMILLLKFQALLDLNSTLIPITMITGHTLSRFFSASVIYSSNYVTEKGSKVKPVAQGFSLVSLLVLFFTSWPLLILFKSWFIILATIPLILARSIFINYFQKKIGGYTGDCLGAVQQITEVLFYLSVLLWSMYI